MGVFGVFFGCRGDGGFNGRCLGASIGDGGFMLAYISGCRGVIGFNLATWLCPVREKVRPARPGVGASAKKFALSSPGFCGGLFRPLPFVLLCVGFLLVAV